MADRPVLHANLWPEIRNPAHIPMMRIIRAVEKIRRARGVDHTDGFPADLGCETQLYLGAALFAAYPDERAFVIAGCCGVEQADTWFFAELVEIATHAGWMKGEILLGAMAALTGQPEIAAPRPRAEPGPAPAPYTVLRWPPRVAGVSEGAP